MSYRLISKLDMAKQRISELEDMLIKTSKSEMQREEKNIKDKIDYPRIVG